MNYIVVSTYDTFNKYLGTHSGAFQADEVLAIVLLKQLPRYKNHIILRTRDKNELNNCEVVVDVGMEYNIDTMRFDHHNTSFYETFNNNFKTRLSSAGLLYKNFGLSVLKELLGSLSLTELNLLYNKIYRNFIEAIDAIDNGMPICDGKQNYIILTGISSRVSYLNPEWNEECDDNILNQRFSKALKLVEKEFKEHIYYLYNSWLSAYNIVNNSINNRYNIHISGQIIVLERYCPWNAHLSIIEYDLRIKSHIKFVIYKSKYNNTWNINTVNNQRFPIFMCDATNIYDCIFINDVGTYSCNKTLQGAISMCSYILNL